MDRQILNDPDPKGYLYQFDRLTLEQQNQLLDWCKLRLRKTSGFETTSHELKHYYQRETRMYVYRGVMNTALARLGHPAYERPHSTNWGYNLQIITPETETP